MEAERSLEERKNKNGSSDDTVENKAKEGWEENGLNMKEENGKGTADQINVYDQNGGVAKQANGTSSPKWMKSEVSLISHYIKGEGATPRQAFTKRKHDSIDTSSMATTPSKRPKQEPSIPKWVSVSTKIKWQPQEDNEGLGDTDYNKRLPAKKTTTKRKHGDIALAFPSSKPKTNSTSRERKAISDLSEAESDILPPIDSESDYEPAPRPSGKRKRGDVNSQNPPTKKRKRNLSFKSSKKSENLKTSRGPSTPTKSRRVETRSRTASEQKKKLC
ncbi:hypothetical protein ABW20_dc0102124 [Dactylellina cionopaga]|nr:hypothetical protein ABW20_dc0102124 [Dactylellina cionopaga]